MTTRLILITLAGFIFSACYAAQPGNLNNLCEIFQEKPAWYKSSKRSFEKWGVPIHVQMAIIHQESHFESDAKPPRMRLLGIIPTLRPSTAYGYAQIKDETWAWYRLKSGNSGADRDDFADVVDFIGWYGSHSQKRLGISKWNAEQQYLAYHEGHGGYEQRTHAQKPWLQKVAQKVGFNASRYSQQLAGCREKLDRSWSFWPF